MSLQAIKKKRENIWAWTNSNRAKRRAIQGNVGEPESNTRQTPANTSTSSASNKQQKRPTRYFHSVEPPTQNNEILNDEYDENEYDVTVHDDNAHRELTKRIVDEIIDKLPSEDGSTNVIEVAGVERSTQEMTMDAVVTGEASPVVNQEQDNTTTNRPRYASFIQTNRLPLTLTISVCAPPRQVSNFVKEGKIHNLPAHGAGSESRLLMLFYPNEYFYFHGAIEIKVLAGAISIFGFKLDSKNSRNYSVYSPFTSMALCVKSVGTQPGLSSLQDKLAYLTNSEDMQVADLLRNIKNTNLRKNDIVCVALVKTVNVGNLPFANVLTLPRRLRDLSPPPVAPNFHIIDTDNEEHQLEIIPDSWTDLTIQSLSDFTVNASKRSILICGRKAAGKSTLARYLVNSLLNSFPKVALLDLDIGQSELNPSGMVSLSILQEPLLGPSFANVFDMKANSVIRSHFIGSTNVQSNPDFYLNACMECFDYYLANLLLDDSTPVPLIINTIGWVEGLGYDILLELIKYIQPLRVVQLFAPPKQRRNFDDLEAMRTHPIRREDLDAISAIVPCISSIPIAPFGTPRVALSSTEKRVLQFLSYFKVTDDIVGRDTTYRVPWSALRVLFVDVDVSPSQALYALNASVVGLVVDSTEYDTVNTNNNGNTDADLYPSFLMQQPSVAASYCVGLGLIKLIDPERRCFYIVTPVPPEKLKNVNTIVRGSLEFPASILVKEATPKTPYLATDFISALGSAQMRGRYLLRRRYADDAQSLPMQ